jgi:preprotein translocase subunit SecE
MADQDETTFQEATMGTGLRATVMELRRVVWPTRQELFRMTSVVVITVLAVAIFIAGIDALLTKGTTFLYGSS